jgi:vitamin B12 transporter
MRRFRRFRFRERERGTPTRQYTRRMVALILAFFLAGSAPATAQGPVKTEPVVVTATRIEEKVSEQASSVSVVTKEEIEIIAPVVAGDALRTLPGIAVQRSGSPGSPETVRIRGGRSEHTLVMIDGFPVNSPTLGEFDIGSITLRDFERVEIVRGAQSALYGSNAMAGVVNFIPSKGVGKPSFGLGVAGGSHSTLQWGGSGKGGGERGGFYLGLNGFRSDGLTRNDDASLVSALGSGDVPIGANNRLHLLLFSTDLNKGTPHDFNTVNDNNDRLTRRSFLAGARWETQVSKAVSLAASGYLFDEYFHVKDPDDPTDLFPGAFDDVTKTQKVNLRLETRISSSRASTTFVGAEFSKDRSSENDPVSFFPISLSAKTYNRSLFLQEELRIGNHSGASLGARLDRNSEAGTVFSPRAGAYHEFEGTGVRVRAAAGSGFRVPTISNKFFPVFGNPDLTSEHSVTYEAGVDAAFLERRVTASATYFFQDYKDLITFDIDTFRNRNANTAFSRGVETEASVRIVPAASVALTYTYTDTWDPERGTDLPGIPEHRGSASLLLNPAPGLDGRIDWIAESDQLDAPLFSGRTRRSGYSRLDVFARYLWSVRGAEVREIALTGRIQNLTNRQYEERIDIPAPGINFLLGVELAI